MVKNPPANAGLVPVLGRSPGVGNGKDRGTWWAMVHGGHKESDMIEQLSRDL